MRVLIAGGGIAGMATAMALERAGVEAAIFEAYEESAGLEAGAYLTIAVNGLDALRAIGAHQRVLEAGFPTRTIRFQSGTGKHLGDLPIGGTLADGTVTHTIKRSDLYSVLSEEVRRRGVALEHGKKFASARGVDGKVVARFADGSEATGDILVGAEGIHSRARQLIDPSAALPHYTGLGNIGGFARAESVHLEAETFLMVWGKRAFFGATTNPSGEIWWFANPPSERELGRTEMASMSAEIWKRRLMELFSVDKSPAVEIIGATQGSLVGTNQYDMPHVRTWRRDRMVIIGDAAHAAAPASGQGASMAIEDAVVLAKSLRETSSISAALATYEAVRRPRVERVVEYGARFSGAKAPGTVSRIIRDLMLPFVFKRAASPKSSRVDVLAIRLPHRLGRAAACGGPRRRRFMTNATRWLRGREVDFATTPRGCRTSSPPRIRFEASASGSWGGPSRKLHQRSIPSGARRRCGSPGTSRTQRSAQRARGQGASGRGGAR